VKSKLDYTLYLVTDRDVLKDKDLYLALEEAIKGGVTLVQLREKN
jgi:thiamine-phosphate pyrophosphorylase